MEIGVTGSTGAVGGMVAYQLAEAGVPQRLIVRDASRAPELSGASVAEATYGDRDASRRALEGVRVLLMVSAAEAPDRIDQHRALIDSAVAAGVEHIVYTSFAGASPTCTFTLGRDHWATEEHIRTSGLSHTLLRDNFYLDFLGMLAGEDGVIRGPAGDGRVAAVARADVADVATAVLLEPGAHQNATYELTGPEALTLDEVAAVVTEVTGRTILYHDESLAEAYASRASYGAPRWQVDAWVSTYTAIAAGELARVTPDVERVAGHPAGSLRDLLAV